MNIKQILKQPINRVPVSAQFINASTVKPKNKMLIPQTKLVSEFDEKGRKQIEDWLGLAVIGTQILDTSTRALTRLKVIPSRNAIHDMVKAFGELEEYFKNDNEFQDLKNDIDSFLFTFLNMTKKDQYRVIKFQENILNKKAKNIK